MALRHASAERIAPLEATIGADRAGCGPHGVDSSSAARMKAGRLVVIPIDLPPSAIPVLKLGIHPWIDQPCAVAEA